MSDFRTFFTTIAVLLGAGILGLPVKLVYCGYWPFMAVLTLTLAMQVAMVYVQLDSLQRAQRALYAHRATLSRRGAAGTELPLPQPDLHTMGKMFLPSSASVGLDAGVLFMFVSIMITYGLAGSDAFSGFSSLSREALITPFVGACTAAIIFAEPFVKILVSVLTSAKVALLVFIIGTVGVVANAVGVQAQQDWTQLMEPFLVGTVAIGGIATMMPVMYPASNPTPSALAHFRWSIVAGIFACFALNAVWARFVLGIVPQTNADALADNMPGISLEQAAADGNIATVPVINVIDNSYPQYAWVATSVKAFIALSITVSFNAVGMGLKNVLNGIAATGARFGFTNRSGRRTLCPCMSVDYKELEAAIHDVDDEAPPEAPGTELSGIETPMLGAASPAVKRRVAAAKARVEAVMADEDGHGDKGTIKMPTCDPSRWLARVVAMWSTPAGRALTFARGSVYILAFGFVWAVALGDPSGFLTVLEVFTSMSLNMSGGVFIAMMSAGAHCTEAVVAVRAAASSSAAGTDALALVADAGEDAPASDASGSTHAPAGDDDRASLLSTDAAAVNSASTATSNVLSLPRASRMEELATSLLTTVASRSLVLLCLITFCVAVQYDVYTASLRIISMEGAGIIVVIVTLLMWRYVYWPILPWLLGMSQGSIVRWWRRQKPRRREVKPHHIASLAWLNMWPLQRALLGSFAVVLANTAALPQFTVLALICGLVVLEIAIDVWDLNNTLHADAWDSFLPPTLSACAELLISSSVAAAAFTVAAWTPAAATAVLTVVAAAKLYAWRAEAAAAGA